MDDSNQIEVPPSFLALFASPSGHRLTEPMSVVRHRYEVCEDLAQMFTDDATALRFKTGGSDQEVLKVIRDALQDSASPLPPGEAGWVVTRLAEILAWEAPEPD